MWKTFHICKWMSFAISTFVIVEETPSGTIIRKFRIHIYFQAEYWYGIKNCNLDGTWKFCIQHKPCTRNSDCHGINRHGSLRCKKIRFWNNPYGSGYYYRRCVEGKFSGTINQLFLVNWFISFFRVLPRRLQRGDTESLLNSYFCEKWAFWAARPVMKKIAGSQYAKAGSE